MSVLPLLRFVPYGYRRWVVKNEERQIAFIAEDAKRGLVVQSFLGVTRAELESMAAWLQTMTVEDEIEQARR